MVPSVCETERWESRNKDVTDELLSLKQNGLKSQWAGRIEAHLFIRRQCCTKVPDLTLNKNKVLAPSSKHFKGNQEELHVWMSLWDWINGVCSC